MKGGSLYLVLKLEVYQEWLSVRSDFVKEVLVQFIDKPP